MSIEPARLARPGIVALPLTGVLYAVGLALRGAPVAQVGSAGFSPADFAVAASSASYQAGWIVLIAGTVLLVFGFLALYAHLADGATARHALPSMILTVSGATLSIGVFGVFAFVYPAIADRQTAGDSGAADLLMAITGGALRPYSSVGGLLYLAGTVWFAVAIWRSGPPYRWAGVLLPVYYLLLLAPVFGLDAALAYVLEFAGAGIITVAGILLTARAFGTGQRPDTASGERVGVPSVAREGDPA